MTSGTAPHTAFPAFEPSRPRRALGPSSSPGCGRCPLRALPGAGHGPTPCLSQDSVFSLSWRACPLLRPSLLRVRRSGSLMRAEGRQRESERRAQAWSPPGW